MQLYKKILGILYIEYYFKILSCVSFQINEMKAGRPAYHIRAKWITLTYPQGSRVYYELDSKGNLLNKKQDNNSKPAINTNNTNIQKNTPVTNNEKVESPNLDTSKPEITNNTNENSENNANANTNAHENINEMENANWIFQNDDSTPDFFENNDLFDNGDSFSWNF